MSVKQVLSTLLAVLGGLAVLAVLAAAAWLLLFDNQGAGSGPAPHEEAGELDAVEGTAVNIHLAHQERTPEDFTNLDVVERTTERSDVAAFSVEEMISGPTEEEADQGLYSELEVEPDSQSSCGGDDFQLEVEEGTFLVRMCRPTQNYGSGESDSIAVAQIAQTFSQFPDVEQTVVLDHEQRCFGDTSGQNDDCYQDLPESLRP